MISVIANFAEALVSDDDTDQYAVYEELAPYLPPDWRVELADALEICADHLCDIAICMDDEDGCDRWGS